MRVSGYVEAGDDAEIVGAAFESEEEVMVLRGGCCVDDFAGCDDDFVAGDCVAGPAGEAGEECYAALRERERGRGVR